MSMSSQLINPNIEYTEIVSEVIYRGHVIIYIPEKYVKISLPQQLALSYDKIEFYILSSESFTFFQNTFLTIDNCDTLIFHFKFREVTDFLKLSDITSLLSSIQRLSEVKNIELYINSSIYQNQLTPNIIIPNNMSISHISLHDDVKYFFSFGKTLPLILNCNLCKLTLKDFKFNRNCQLSMFFNAILNTHCSDLYLENIGVEILTKSNDFELTHYIKVDENGIFFIMDDTIIKTEINKISVINSSLIDVRGIDKIIQKKEKTYELKNVNRNSFIIYSFKIDSFKEENEEMSISIDFDIEEDHYNNDQMDIEETSEQYNLSFLNTDKVYKLIKLKNFDDVKACINLEELKVKEIHFINDSIEFINSIYERLDKNILNHIVLNRIPQSNECLNINSINCLTIKDSFCNCEINSSIKVNKLHLRYNQLNCSTTQSDSIVQKILFNLNNTIQELIIENEVINFLKNYEKSQIKVSNLIIRNIQNTKANLSLIAEVFKDVKNVTLDNIYYNKKEEIDISLKLFLFQHFSNSQITIDYKTFVNILFHENPICTSAEEFYFLSKELIPEQKKDEQNKQNKFLEDIYKKAHNNLLKLLSLNKGIIITYSNRKEYLNVIYDIIAFTKESHIIDILELIASDSNYGFSNYYIHPKILKQFEQQFRQFRLEKKTHKL